MRDCFLFEWVSLLSTPTAPSLIQLYNGSQRRDGGDLQLALSGGSLPHSLAEACHRHSSALPLLKKYLLQHLRDRLQAGQDALYCIALRPGVLSRLQDSLRPQNIPSEAGVCGELQLPRFDVDLDDVLALPEHVSAASRFGAAVQQVMFFHIVRCCPNKLVRVAASDETGFNAADMVIAPRRVLHVDAARKELVVDSSALDWMTTGEQQPFVLSLESFSCEDLFRIYRWSSDSGLSYGMWGDRQVAMPAASAKVLPQALEELLSAAGSGNGYLLDGHQPRAKGWEECFSARLVADGVQGLSFLNVGFVGKGPQDH